MKNRKFSLKNIPGWAIMLAIFGILYATGLQTEAIGQVQRLLLATGLRNASVPDAAAPTAAAAEALPSPTGSSEKVGAGFRMVGLDGTAVPFESLYVIRHGGHLCHASTAPPCLLRACRGR
jgi:hypothetical protein